MSQRQRMPATFVERKPDLFVITPDSGPSQIPREQILAYVEALEARCNTLWGYIQGYDCSCDPVVRFLASELGITVAHAVDMESSPAAD
jgi:hypothetical protein